VITGMGAITCLGETVEEYWQNLVAGKSGIGPMTLTDPSAYGCRVAGEVRTFDPDRYIERRESRRMARMAQFSVAAASRAIEDAALDLRSVDPYTIGVLVGNGNGSVPDIEEGIASIRAKGPGKVDPYFMPKILPNMAAGQISLQYGLKGYNSTITTACAASTQAIGEALEVIRRGAADVMVTGGTEAEICEIGLAGFSVLRAMSTAHPDEPALSSRPFDRDRDGFVPAEGSAMFVIESLEHAERRGARILCELGGYGATADAFHIVAPAEDGEGAARAMRLAIRDAGLELDGIDYINAHGTSTPLNDVSETRAIKAVFGESAYEIPVSSTKSMLGHALGASGAVELVGCVRAITDGIIPPTINLDNPDPDCDLDYVPNVARQARVDAVLKNSFGFGGQNACLVLKRFVD